jgi:PAS domain S-box-containing protein
MPYGKLLGRAAALERLLTMSMKKIRSLPRLPRYWPIVAVFVAMTILQALVAAFSIQMLSTVRAYVTGESLYSKGQKDAQIYLLDYVAKHQEVDYVRFMSALAMPLGDRAAREALQRPTPDVSAARQGFLDGGNHPDDIDGLIRMFRWFQRVPFMSRPIATWTEGDQTIQEMRELVDRARDRIRAGDPQSPAVDAMRVQVPLLNGRLTLLTSEFSSQLGEASRTTQRLLLGLNSFIAVLLTISGLGFVRRSVRMQAAAELRMERLIHAVTDGVVTIDEDRKIVLFNRAAETMFGIGAIDALGSPIDRFVKHLLIPNRPVTEDATPIASSAGSLQALTGRTRDGSTFPVEASLSRLQMEREALTTIVLRDISARVMADAERRAHEALEASSKAKTEFLSRMSHELRTPLNAVIGFSKLMRLDTVKPLSSEQLERVQHVESAGAHLLALVNDVLDLSRIESGEMAVSPEAIQLLRVIEEAATMVSPLVTKAGIEVFLAAELPASSSGQRADTPPGEVWVKADPVRLRQVLVNLLSNAVKYNRPGGRVTLTWKQSRDECEVVVTDTGRGIPPERLASLFQPFNRLGAESSTVEGTGIGLVLSRQLAEMMGGSLTVTSTFGEGTSASLKLRVASAPIIESDSGRLRRPAARDAYALRVLYAEDDEVNAELVRQLVTLRQGISLRVATTGAIALDIARTDSPDLMLVDMNLGDMTGIELARELRRDRATRDIRLVALSADALPEQIRAAMDCGFESYLTKPINFDELLTVLDKHSQEAFS